jgi:hypothetical protein
VLVEQRVREARAVAEAPEDRALPDARRLGEHVHRDVLDAVLAHEPPRGVEDLQAVARGVRALGGL